MKKQDLLKEFDDELLEKLFGFCYARTKDSYEAEELCSDIVFALLKAANTEGEIESIYPFIWRVARNVYADFSDHRKKRSETVYDGDSEELFLKIADEDNSENTMEELSFMYRRIAFLTKAYREVMILFYLDGLSTAEIAKKQGTSEGAVRQRLFSARKKIKSEVEEMTDTYHKPVALDKINYVFWGTGKPSWGDPSKVCSRMFSHHVLWLCHKKPRTASEIAEELNVPTVYVEEELEILRKGENGEYGLLRRLENGKYGINFVLFDKEVFEKASALYTERLPKICDIILRYIEEHKEDYLAFPYLNKKVDMNLILWQQITKISSAFSENVKSILKEKHFADATELDRPYSIFGFEDHGKYYGGGMDGTYAENICGYSKVSINNIYISRIQAHFRYGHNISRDPQLQLAIRAIEGLDINSLTEQEKEHAAKSIECGYLYRDGDMLYTKILVTNISDIDRVFDISRGLRNGYFEEEAEFVAGKLAKLINSSIPEYLHNEWTFANVLANAPVLDAVVECLIEKGILVPPEDGIGAEGCWMSVEK
ncbi:MAG: RNA polymerase sigma factor [Clostridia bacterium]|nr:RNA polymerase sigma factor [Clostridia bacterium]